ncbi:ABC transporter ATP-binding protein [Bifidobacterium psychraerophilum]|jgi:iron complex transport system ATP-binding protein|uniref:ABC transporter ATP-binding protein n=1 Tax=Bifidobacterium psychraerophilum TaxID=218140 RepID=UPI0023F1B627|nr:ABC transporter ATP-binding protein [Bifidobacterium psychraerophilum]MCI1660822.1 ABC transporter ATP-binding protein [Bifidobacterium psychraerophilum]MCI1804392.1 ABC transporter ATP-binding protein [Bifidobacterium psychraerophilum]MCI2177451.1 ABC transporter ATP-binding protein [Bifidobacterium psychraerophilum]MCI2182735.1 ABC transporter ATP-binding protein [Bifidobacterium psychraerophilum]
MMKTQDSKGPDSTPAATGRPGPTSSITRDPHLETTGLSVGYGEHLVINNIDLDIPVGTIGAIIGPNGCGKSTFLRALARLLKPVNGTVLLNGADIASMPTKRVATQVGLLPQSSIAPEGITVSDLVSRGRYPYHRFGSAWNAEDQTAVDHALRATGMEGFADRPVDELSGGQRQRAWIALTLAQQTGIVLLDEPTTFLDVSYQLEVLDLLSDLNASEGTTIVMVLHDVNLAARYADWMLALCDGHQEALGTPYEILTEELVHRVFGVEATIVDDPASGMPMMIADRRHSLRARRALHETPVGGNSGARTAPKTERDAHHEHK